MSMINFLFSCIEYEKGFITSGSALSTFLSQMAAKLKETSRAIYTTLTNFSTNYFVMCKFYTDVGGIKQLYHVCLPVRKIIHSLKLMDYLHVQADNPWYNYYITNLDTPTQRKQFDKPLHHCIESDSSASWGLNIFLGQIFVKEYVLALTIGPHSYVIK